MQAAAGGGGESGGGAVGPYGHHVPMDLHVPQHFPYYAGCIMDNQAMFTAQQMQYKQMYAGIDPTGRRMDELAAQGGLNSRYGQHPKEKSRDAARSRRGKENYEFYELAKMLPLPGAITSQLDKASIVRLTIAYLRLREFAAHGDPPWNRDGRFDGKATLKGSTHRRLHNPLHNADGLAVDVFQEHEGTHILQSLDGFAISLASDARFLYISETVSIYLGLSQVELTGSSFFDYIHQADHDELAQQLGVTIHGPGSESPLREGEEGANSPVGAAPPIPDVCYPVTTLMTNNQEDKNGKPSYDRAFCIRMKSTLTKRGCHFKSSGYRVVLMLGKLRPQYSYPHTKKSATPIMGFIGLAIALPPPSVHEVRLETDMFVTRLSFDFKIAHCEPKVCDMLDYSADDLTGKSMYSLVHAADVHKIKQTHVDLIKKGQVMSNYYRLMNRQGGYTWMQICATLVCNTKNSDEQSIICVNYVLSGSQYSSVVMASEQIKSDQQSDDDQGGGTRNGSPESVKDGDYSNQGSSPSGGHSSLEQSSSLDQGGGVGVGDQYQFHPTDDSNLRLGKASLAASDHGLGSPPSRETDRPESRDSKAAGQPTPPPTSSPSPHHRYSTPLPPDQNSNSVRDLENAMSKHLPREKEAAASLGLIPTSLPGAPSLEASHLLKQIYSRPGYFPDLEAGVSADPSQFLNYARLAGTTGYPPASPAQPVPLKPNVYSPAMTGHGLEGYAGAFAASADQSHIYSHSSSSFHLYNRPGQSWYSGN